MFLPASHFGLVCKVALITAAAVALIAPAHAQIVVPGPFVPGRQGESMKEAPVPQSRPQSGAPLLPQMLPPEQAQNLSFVLKGLTLTGGAVLPAPTFDDLWRPLIGQRITVAKLYKIVNAITARYTQEGYALSFAMLPEQKIEGGQVALHIVEGSVSKVSFTGDPLVSFMGSGEEAVPQGLRVQQMVQHILDSRPLKIADLDRTMMLLNTLPGVTARSSLSAANTVQGTSELTIDIKRQRAVVEFGADNRMSQESRRWSVGGSVTLNGALNGADTLHLETHCAKNGCDNAYDATLKWSTLVGSQGLRFTALANRNGSRPVEGFLTPLEFWGSGQRLYFTADYPLLRTRPQSLDIGAGFDISDSKTKTFAGTLTQDKVRVLDVHLLYDFADVWDASNIFQFRLSQGLPGLGATDYANPLKSRVYGSARFTNAFVGVVRTQPLGGLAPWLEQTTLVLEAEGQMALSRALLSASQCAYGGSHFGRGYDGGAFGGDHCLQGIAELRQNTNILSVSVQPYVFADAGRAWIKGALLDDEARLQTASSAGLGVRFGESTAFSGDLQLAFPMQKAYGENNQKNPRLFFSIKMRY